MQTEFLIIGQGISGSWLSWFLEKEKRDFHVIDYPDTNTPSRLAAGIINPVTGRRHVETWMADTLLPFAWEQYNEMGKFLGIEAISQKPILDFFPSPQMRLSFLERVNEGARFVSIPAEENRFREFFNYEFGYGLIQPVYTAHLETLLPAWRKYLLEQERLSEESFDINYLERSADNIIYKNISASFIIFCNGHEAALNPYFKNLPFAPNKGEALTLEIPDLPQTAIFKKGLSLVPLAQTGQWWIGSSYEWDFKHNDPTDAFRQRTEQLLQQWLHIPFRVTNHVAGVRPATLERRPFIGLHPHFQNIGILNGLGTKGCSLAPFFAKELIEELIHQRPVHPEAAVSRYTKLLQRAQG